MKDLKQLSDDELLHALQSLVSQERKLLTEILCHLKEVEDRKLFLKTGYSSLFDYAVHKLQYSESSALRRISAMRLIKAVPEVENAIQEGRLTLSKASMPQSYFKEEAKLGQALNSDQKREVLEELEAKSTRESEKFFAARLPESPQKDKERILTENLTEIRFVADAKLMSKLQKFRNIHSHLNPHPNYQELFEALVDIALKEKDPLRKGPKKEKAQKAPLVHIEPPQSPPAPEVDQKKIQTHETPQSPNPRFIPAALKKIIWSRDQSTCTYQCQKTGKKYGSKFQIQIDHIVPIAMGGTSTEENLRLLCRAHNILAATQHFGVRKMAKYETIQQGH